MKIALLGDSILGDAGNSGYGARLAEFLGDGYELYMPKENCRFAKYTQRLLFDWRQELQDCEIVHWNNGMWDICEICEDGKPFSSLDEYVESILRIADVLCKRHKKVIFATTTPVREGNPYNRNEIIERYNAAVVPKLQERGVIINDLYSLVAKDVNRYVRESDKLHLTDEGIAVCARQVAKVLLETSKK